MIERCSRTGKARIETEALAIAAARRINDRSDNARPYRCKHCASWHVGTGVHHDMGSISKRMAARRDARILRRAAE